MKRKWLIRSALVVFVLVVALPHYRTKHRKCVECGQRHSAYERSFAGIPYSTGNEMTSTIVYPHEHQWEQVCTSDEYGLFACLGYGIGCRELDQRARMAIEVNPLAFGEKATVLKVAESWPIEHETHHVQGLCVNERFFWISSVDTKAKKGWVYRVDRGTGKMIAERDITLGDQYHPGGMQIASGELWVPVAEYKPLSTSTMLRLDPETLETKGSFPVEDHLGGVAIDDRGNVFAANWDCRFIYLFDGTGKELKKVPSPTKVAYQDMKWRNGELWAAGTLRQGIRSQAVVDVLDVADWVLVNRYVLDGKPKDGKFSFSREGFDYFEGSFYLLPEDGPNSTVYRFPLK